MQRLVVALEFVLGIILLLTATAQVKAYGQDGSYFCTSEVEAGLRYDSSLKQWRNARFKETQKFILKMRFVRAEQQGDLTVEIYNVTVTDEGSNRPDDCFAQMYNLRGDQVEVNMYQKFGGLTCYTLSRSYKFNMKNNRFLSAYIQGYVNGDNNDDTPAFAAGRCTKIN